MFALLKWFWSGSPFLELAPSSACPSTRSAFSKLPAADVKPYGDDAKWSWYRFR